MRLYRHRAEAAPKITDHEQQRMAKLIRRVLGSPEGLEVLDYICETLCHIDSPVVSSDPYFIVDANARRNVGITLAHLVLAPIEDSDKPEVMT